MQSKLEGKDQENAQLHNDRAKLQLELDGKTKEANDTALTLNEKNQKLINTEQYNKMLEQNFQNQKDINDRLKLEQDKLGETLREL
jgi:hypothetical protein